jgi:hypothetical protein
VARDEAQAFHWMTKPPCKASPTPRTSRRHVLLRPWRGADDGLAVHWFRSAARRARPRPSKISDRCTARDAAWSVATSWRTAGLPRRRAGLASAQTLLGEAMPKAGRNARNYPLALAWYRKAALQHDPYAQRASADVQARLRRGAQRGAGGGLVPPGGHAGCRRRSA